MAKLVSRDPLSGNYHSHGRDGEQTGHSFTTKEAAKDFSKNYQKTQRAEESGSFEKTRVRAQKLNAVSNYMQEKRLTEKADDLHKVGVAAAKIENASQGYKNLHDKLSRKPSIYGEQ